VNPNQKSKVNHILTHKLDFVTYHNHQRPTGGDSSKTLAANQSQHRSSIFWLHVQFRLQHVCLHHI